jgi:hypothetical protein
VALDDPRQVRVPGAKLRDPAVQGGVVHGSRRAGPAHGTECYRRISTP